MNQPFHLSLYYSTVVVLSLALERDSSCRMCCLLWRFLHCFQRGPSFCRTGNYDITLSHCHVKPQRKSRSTLSLLVE